MFVHQRASWLVSGHTIITTQLSDQITEPEKFSIIHPQRFSVIQPQRFLSAFVSGELDDHYQVKLLENILPALMLILEH